MRCGGFRYPRSDRGLCSYYRRALQPEPGGSPLCRPFVEREEVRRRRQQEGRQAARHQRKAARGRHTAHDLLLAPAPAQLSSHALTTDGASCIVLRSTLVRPRVARNSVAFSRSRPARCAATPRVSGRASQQHNTRKPRLCVSGGSTASHVALVRVRRPLAARGHEGSRPSLLFPS